MRIAVMQPYIFPYIGYFQMIKAVDKFVFYEDVNFIKKGWINRNRILNQNQDLMFTVPLSKVSQNKLISETEINRETYSKWVEKIEQTLVLNYKKAPFFYEVNKLVLSIFKNDFKTIDALAIESIIGVARYLNLKTSFVRSSVAYKNRDLEREERLIDICKNESATHYINALGGKELYAKERFKEKGVVLNFIKPLPIAYKQFNDEFVPWLSIIDVLMFNSIAEVNGMLEKYDLV